jgi:hypothetical protein
LGQALGFSSFIGGGAGTAVSLGSIAGAGWGSAGGAVDLGSISSALPSAATEGSIFGSTTLGGFLGGAGLGALASSLIFGNKNDASLGGLGGSAAGALIGSLFGGPLIGGVIGGLLGGGLGSLTGSSNQGAIANFSDGGLSSYLFKQGGGNNGQLSTQAANNISQAIQTLQNSGVNISLGNITGLSIGSDKSYVYDSAGGKQKLAGGDVDAVTNAILDRILPSISATTPQAQAILDKYNANGGITSGNLSQLEQDLNAASQFADALANLNVGPTSLSAGAQALKAINGQIDPLVKQAQSLGLSTDSLEAARQAAIVATQQQYEDAVSSSLEQITDPIGYQLDQLIQAQQANLQSMQDIGADISQVQALDDAQFKQLLSGLSVDQLNALGQSHNLFGNSSFDAVLQAANDNQALIKSFQDLGNSIDTLTSQAQDAASAAQDTANNWGNAFGALTGASKTLLVSDSSLSPLDQYRNSAAQFDSLRTAAFGGDAIAASDIASFASDFLKTSFSYNGSTTAYGSDLTYVQSTLNSLASYSQGQQSLAQQQADSLASAVTLLAQIKQAISDQSNDTVDALNGLSGDVNQVAAQIKNANLQARVAS